MTNPVCARQYSFASAGRRLPGSGGKLTSMPDTLPEELYGAWRLVAYEDRDSESDPWSSPLGADGRGLLFVAAPSLVSVQLQGGDTYVGYFGTASARDVVRVGGASLRGTLLLSVEGGYPPDALAADVPRPFELRGDELILGDQRTWRRRLVRAASP